VVCSKLGWIRAFKGHHEVLTDLKFKEGDGACFQLLAKTTDKLIVFASDGRFFTLGCDKLPSAKGQGEPVRLMVEMDGVYPGYGFAGHKGYHAAVHVEALARLGPCPIHRRSWAPIRALLGED
jgi:hypothetical protein